MGLEEFGIYDKIKHLPHLGRTLEIGQEMIIEMIRQKGMEFERAEITYNRKDEKVNNPIRQMVYVAGITGLEDCVGVEPNSLPRLIFVKRFIEKEDLGHHSLFRTLNDVYLRDLFEYKLLKFE